MEEEELEEWAHTGVAGSVRLELDVVLVSGLYVVYARDLSSKCQECESPQSTSRPQVFPSSSCSRP